MTIRQTPNAAYAQTIRIKLKENDGFCPCRVERNRDTKCICKDFREQMERGELGECHCGLYEIVEVD